MHVDPEGWGDAAMYIRSDTGHLQVDGFEYGDDLYTSHGAADVCLDPSRCYNITVVGPSTAKWSIRDASGVLVADGTGPFSDWVCHCGHRGGDDCADCTGVVAPEGGTLGSCATSGTLAHGTHCSTTCGSATPGVVPFSCWNGTLASASECCPVNGTGWSGR